MQVDFPRGADECKETCTLQPVRGAPVFSSEIQIIERKTIYWIFYFQDTSALNSARTSFFSKLSSKFSKRYEEMPTT